MKPRAAYSIPVCLCFCGLLALLGGVRDAAAAVKTTTYRADVWSTDEGLPQISVRAILQTRDGYLWFTTLNGLVRFDRARFQVFDESNTAGISSNRFNSLYKARKGICGQEPQRGGRNPPTRMTLPTRARTTCKTFH